MKRIKRSAEHVDLEDYVAMTFTPFERTLQVADIHKENNC